MKDKKNGCKHRWIRREETTYVIKMKVDGWPENTVGLRGFGLDPLKCERCGERTGRKEAEAIMKVLMKWKEQRV